MTQPNHMTLDHPKVKKIISQCERRVKKLTGNSSVMIMFHKPSALIPFDEIMQIICNQTGEPKQNILNRTRRREVVIARQLICFYAKIYSGMSHKTIAQSLGYKDHTTSIHSIQCIKDLIDSGNEVITGLVARINQQLNITA